MELEIYAIVYSSDIRAHTYGESFIFWTNHKNAVHLDDATVPNLVRWRIILSEFKCLVELIPGTFYVVSDQSMMDQRR